MDLSPSALRKVLGDNKTLPQLTDIKIHYSFLTNNSHFCKKGRFDPVKHALKSPWSYEPGSLFARCWWLVWSAWPPAWGSLWSDDRDLRRTCSPSPLKTGTDRGVLEQISEDKNKQQSEESSPPMSSMVSSPVCSTWRTGGTFCLASTSRAFRSIRTDSSVRR